jgi:hypothetical protein
LISGASNVEIRSSGREDPIKILILWRMYNEISLKIDHGNGIDIIPE